MNVKPPPRLRRRGEDAMKKYKVNLMAFRTVFASRDITVSANSEEEASEKAIARAYVIWSKNPRVNDVGSIQVGDIEEIV